MFAAGVKKLHGQMRETILRQRNGFCGRTYTVESMATDAAQPEGPPGEPHKPFEYVYSEDFAQFLASLGASMLVSTYQAGKLMVIRAQAGRMSTLLRSFEQPMGMAMDGDRIAIGTQRQVWVLRNASDIAPQLDPPGTHDACFVPRSCHVTGDIRVHEMGWAGPKRDELIIVNTRFSCLCRLDPDYSFVPTWRPPFVTALVAEDRCHLNGMAMDDGQPKYVTALGQTDEQQGWRAGKAHGGVIIDVASGELVTQGLSMPHSPRLHAGRLFVLNSGMGELQTVDERTGRRDTVARFPGYTRGLAMVDKYAFVCLSKIREKREFGGLPIEENLDELKCGVYVVNLETGEGVGFVELTQGCTELFEVLVLQGMRFPSLIGFQKDTINGIFIVPPGMVQVGDP
jgi:uncharacterized protein (TIGR03032 family)